MALDMDKRSRVKNLCPWAVTFVLPNSGGEITAIRLDHRLCRWSG